MVHFNHFQSTPLRKAKTAVLTHLKESNYRIPDQPTIETLHNLQGTNIVSFGIYEMVHKNVISKGAARALCSLIAQQSHLDTSQFPSTKKAFEKESKKCLENVRIRQRHIDALQNEDDLYKILTVDFLDAYEHYFSQGSYSCSLLPVEQYITTPELEGDLTMQPTSCLSDCLAQLSPIEPPITLKSVVTLNDGNFLYITAMDQKYIKWNDKIWHLNELMNTNNETSMLWKEMVCDKYDEQKEVEIEWQTLLYGIRLVVLTDEEAAGGLFFMMDDDQNNYTCFLKLITLLLVYFIFGVFFVCDYPPKIEPNPNMIQYVMRVSFTCFLLTSFVLTFAFFICTF